MTPTPMIVDLSHNDELPNGGWAAFKQAGVVGAILKATQGTGMVDKTFLARRQAALGVFGDGCVHSYHFLDGSDPVMQVGHYLEISAGCPGRWLDYEGNLRSQCSRAQAVQACQTRPGKPGSWPGMYGSDKDRLGEAIDAGHFGPCGKWIAGYGQQPTHHWDLWQYTAGESNKVAICGGFYDLSVFNGTADECRAWMQAMAK